MADTQGAVNENLRFDRRISAKCTDISQRQLARRYHAAKTDLGKCLGGQHILTARLRARMQCDIRKPPSKKDGKAKVRHDKGVRPRRKQRSGKTCGGL